MSNTYSHKKEGKYRRKLISFDELPYNLRQKSKKHLFAENFKPYKLEAIAIAEMQYYINKIDVFDEDAFFCFYDMMGYFDE